MKHCGVAWGRVLHDACLAQAPSHHAQCSHREHVIHHPDNAQMTHACRALEGELAAAQARAATAEAAVKAKEKELSSLTKLVEAARACEYEAEVARLQSEEAVRWVAGRCVGRPQAAFQHAEVLGNGREEEGQCATQVLCPHDSRL